MNSLLSLTAASLLAACASPPLAIDARHPASVEAPEASARALRPTLRDDPNTLRTHELLSQREQQAKAAAAETPAGQTFVPQSHENH